MKQMDRNLLEESLSLLGEILDTGKAPPIHLVVIGGSALLASGIISRTTGDVDILARRGEVDGEIIDARPLPDFLISAAEKVAAEFRLAPNWLNASAALFSTPLRSYPEEFWQDRIEKSFGERLRISFIGRSGQLYLKLHAAVDPERRKRADDLSDLKALSPSASETERVVRWLFRENLVSEGENPLVVEVLESLGHEDLISRI